MVQDFRVDTVAQICKKKRKENMLKFGLKGLTRSKLKGHIINCVRLYVGSELNDNGGKLLCTAYHQRQSCSRGGCYLSEDYPCILFIFS